MWCGVYVCVGYVCVCCAVCVKIFIREEKLLWCTAVILETISNHCLPLYSALLSSGSISVCDLVVGISAPNFYGNLEISSDQVSSRESQDTPIPPPSPGHL